MTLTAEQIASLRNYVAAENNLDANKYNGFKSTPLCLARNKTVETLNKYFNHDEVMYFLSLPTAMITTALNKYEAKQQ